MGTIIGIDVGGSTTKIVSIDKNGVVSEPLLVRATDPKTSLYGAFGKFLDTNSLSLNDIDSIKITGVGSSYVKSKIYGVKTERVSEFISIGKGGLYLSDKKDAIIVSMGTGTAIVHAKADGSVDYLGGTGVGGGTLMGLSKLLFGADKVEYIESLAKNGDLANVDLRISDISEKIDEIHEDLTASNFGKVENTVTKSDLALGVINMIFETIAMVVLFASKSVGVKDIILTGNLTTLESCKDKFDELSRQYNVNFIIPPSASFATVIGAALADKGDEI
jgi:type II pantothenate kinase